MLLQTCVAAAQAASHFSADDMGRRRGRLQGSSGNRSRGICPWFTQYLCPSPLYNAAQFRSRFRVPLGLYRVLERELSSVEPRLLQGTDCTGRRGHPLHVKLLNALRRLGHGRSFHDLEDQSCMSIEAQRQSFMFFLNSVSERFGPHFLNREPTVTELQRLSDSFAARGFPGCVGSVDCMKIKWKNCPRAFKGQYYNPKDGKLAVLSCEAVADGDLYCWHWFAGRPGTNNDVTVADHSPLFNDILTGKRRIHLPNGYVLGGVRRSWPVFYLGDGIYPKWAIFFLPVAGATTEKELNAARRQESVRKDVERLFGCLQGRFRILRHEREEWSDEIVQLISQVCVILHNMIVTMVKRGELDGEAEEGGRHVPVDLVGEYADPQPRRAAAAAPLQTPCVGLAALLHRADEVKSPTLHATLKAALIDHLWAARGEQ